ncbi:MAG: capsid protein [Lachnospira sp.]
MNIFTSMAEKIKTGIRTWLHIQPAVNGSISIQETLDYEGNAIKNQIWYRGESEELSQLYSQIDGDKTRFWSASCTIGMEIRKIHVGLPAMLCDMLASIVTDDMNLIDAGSRQTEWDKIAEENDFIELVKQAITETLYIGDGAFKISFDTNLSKYPILEFYSGDKTEIIRDRGRVKEIVFKTVYNVQRQEYVLLEHYGIGYIHYELTRGSREYDLSVIPELAHLSDVTWNDKFIMAVPLLFYKSAKYKGRGKSIFDAKIDNFDALDEAWSQWMDALRRNRTKEYIPENMLPRNPLDGKVLKPNAFDNAYIQTDGSMAEGTVNKIELVQGNIPHESYLATYITALDLCLQGIMSPSTLGIDVKKLDNAEAQREKEKATLYSRNNIVEQLQKVLPKLVTATFNAIDTLNKTAIKDIDIDVTFGEYANPSFESQVETVSKAKQGGIMSIEASVDELYGDTKDDEWKQEEISRLKAEQGISDMEEPALNMQVDGFSVDSRLNGAQVGSLMNVISMVKSGQLTRIEAINIIVSTLGVPKEQAESFIENKI